MRNYNSIICNTVYYGLKTISNIHSIIYIFSRNIII